MPIFLSNTFLVCLKNQEPACWPCQHYRHMGLLLFVGHGAKQGRVEPGEVGDEGDESDDAVSAGWHRARIFAGAAAAAADRCPKAAATPAEGLGWRQKAAVGPTGALGRSRIGDVAATAKGRQNRWGTVAGAAGGIVFEGSCLSSCAPTEHWVAWLLASAKNHNI